VIKDEAMRIALEALENNRCIIESEINPPEALEEVDVAIAVLRQALEQPEQFFYGQDPNVLPAHDKGESYDK